MTPRAPGRHRAAVRPRYGRIATLGSSATVVLVAALGGIGVLPSSAGDDPVDRSSATEAGPSDRPSAQQGPLVGVRPAGEPGEVAQPGDPARPAGPAGTQTSARADGAERPDGGASDGPAGGGLVPVAPADATLLESALPAGSGTGKRVVFSEGKQRVWLVSEDEQVRRTYLVSGSIYDNLDPGTFQVYSRDKNAVGIEDSGTMRFFVRFTRGDTGAAIGFHDIPVDDGEPVQTVQQLGTPLSHGCIRQKRADAAALWKFAPIGTTVVVTA